MGLFDFFKFRKPKHPECVKSSITEERQISGVCDIPLDAKYTPENITSLGRRDIFVFGYGARGHHEGSDARTAINRFGAVRGCADGLYGNSYAIPIGWNFDDLRPYIDKFLEFAENEKALTFYVTKIGCEWYDIRKVAPLFRNAYSLPNVILPIEFAHYIENENRSIHPQKILDTIEAAHRERVKHIDTPIKIIGVGGGGCNVVGRLIEAPYHLAEYSILTNEITTINTSKVLYRFLLQDSDPCTVKDILTQEAFNQYFASQNENTDIIHSILDDTAQQLIVVVGFGGGFGTYCTKWLVSIAEQKHIPVKVVCTIPFDFEGKRKQERALEAAHSLIEKGVDVKILNAEELTQMYSDMSFLDCFSLLDEYVANSVNDICNDLSLSQLENKEDGDKKSGKTITNMLPYEVTTHCFGMTRTFADILLTLNEERKYTSPDQALSDLGEYVTRFRERGDNVAFLSVRTLQEVLYENPEIFGDGALNTDRLRELVFQEKYIHPKIEWAYVLYCKEKLMNLVLYLNDFRRYTRPEELRQDLFENTDVLQFSACAPITGFYYFVMSGATGMNYPVQFFVRAIRNLWSEITTDGILDADKMRRLMFGNHDESVKKFGLEVTIQRDYIEDSPCHPEVFVPKIMGTAPIYVKDDKTGRYMRSCGEGKGPNSIPDWLEFQIAKQILANDKSYKHIGYYYIPKYDNTLPVYGEYAGRLVFKSQEEKVKFIEEIKRGKQ